jgi:hypothetical protein
VGLLQLESCNALSNQPTTQELLRQICFDFLKLFRENGSVERKIAREKPNKRTAEEVDNAREIMKQLPPGPFCLVSLIY